MAEEVWHWRNSMRPVRFFMFDARAAIPWLVVLVYIRIITICLALLITILFYMVEKKGLVLPSALRALRCWFLGPVRPSIITAHKRTFRDYDY